MNLLSAMNIPIAFKAMVPLRFHALPHSHQGAENLQPERKIAVGKGVRIEYFVYGTGPETLLMLAGNGRWARDMDGIARRVAQGGYRAVTINHRGIEGSEGPLDKATLHDLAADVWLVADDMKLDKVHLLGKTFGQRVMRTASADMPQRVLSLTLMGAGGEIKPSEETQKALLRMREPGLPEAEWLRLYAFANFSKVHHDKAKLGVGGSFAGVAGAQVEISNRTPMKEWGHGGEAPMLILQGLDDKVAVPQNAFNLATSRPNTLLIALPNCGHNMIYEMPDEASEHVLAFLTKNGGSG